MSYSYQREDFYRLLQTGYLFWFWWVVRAVNLLADGGGGGTGAPPVRL